MVSISALFNALAWFGVLSTVTGLLVAGFLGRSPGTQRLLTDVEEKGMKVEDGRQSTAVEPLLTLAGALMLGVFLGFLLAHLIAIQAQVQTLAHLKMIV